VVECFEAIPNGNIWTKTVVATRFHLCSKQPCQLLRLPSTRDNACAVLTKPTIETARQNQCCDSAKIFQLLSFITINRATFRPNRANFGGDRQAAATLKHVSHHYYNIGVRVKLIGLSTTIGVSDRMTDDDSRAVYTRLYHLLTEIF